MNRKALSLVMAGVLSVSAVIPAFAENNGAFPEGNGTDVYAGVMLKDPDSRVKVTVPTLFAFVVNGSVKTGDAGAVTSSNGGILLPNVKVKVTNSSSIFDAQNPNASGTDGEYKLEYEGDGVMYLRNFSTKAAEIDQTNTSGRIGMNVTVNGNIKNDGTAAERNNWEYVPAVTGTADPTEFKKYNISIAGNSLNTWVNGGYQLANGISLDAPTGIANGANLNATTKLANTGSEKRVVFDVAVGGRQNQYKQVEESAKVGTIVWTVTTEEVTGDFYTAPDNTYLNGEKETDANGDIVDTDTDYIGLQP